MKKNVYIFAMFFSLTSCSTGLQDFLEEVDNTVTEIGATLQSVEDVLVPSQSISNEEVNETVSVVDNTREGVEDVPGPSRSNSNEVADVGQQQAPVNSEIQGITVIGKFSGPARVNGLYQRFRNGEYGTNPYYYGVAVGLIDVRQQIHNCNGYFLDRFKQDAHISGFQNDIAKINALEGQEVFLENVRKSSISNTCVFSSYRFNSDPESTTNMNAEYIGESMPQTEQQSTASVLREQNRQAQSSPAESNMYGWFNGVYYSQRQNPLIEGVPLKQTDSQIDIGVLGVTVRMVREIKCNAVILDQALPNIEGMEVGDLTGIADRDINKAFDDYVGTFIRLNNVEIYQQRNQKFCVPSSVEVVTDFPKTNVEFVQVRNLYLTQAFNVIIRAASGNSSRHLNPTGAQRAGAGPADFECSSYTWSTAEAAKLMEVEFQDRDIQSLNTANIEFVGVRPVLSEAGQCEFDTMNISIDQQTQQEMPVLAASNISQDDSLFFESINVTVTGYYPSNLDNCNRNSSPEVQEYICTMSGIENISPSLIFDISNDEIGRLNASLSMTRIRGHWKEEFIPNNTDGLASLRGKKVTLINVSMPFSRAKTYYFEKVVSE